MAGTKKTAAAKGSDKRIRELAKLLEETGLSEIEIEEDGTRIRVATVGRAVAPVAAAPAPAAPAPVAEAAPEPVSPDAHPGALKSPMVGTAFISPEPGADPFVRVGDQVSEGQTLLIIEAMKVMNPIPAAKSGKVIEILVTDSEPVEFGQPLMIIE